MSTCGKYGRNWIEFSPLWYGQCSRKIKLFHLKMLCFLINSEKIMIPDFVFIFANVYWSACCKAIEVNVAWLWKSSLTIIKENRNDLLVHWKWPTRQANCIKILLAQMNGTHECIQKSSKWVQEAAHFISVDVCMFTLHARFHLHFFFHLYFTIR